MKAQVYKDPRPAEHFARFHERTRTPPPGLGLRARAAACSRPYLLLFYRARCIDSGQLPPTAR